MVRYYRDEEHIGIFRYRLSERLIEKLEKVM